ncbi:MAG: hypothetical protein KDD67_10355 [Ignavibacteriae bacterium]|nr:hypothetical protein [Ignavibacteriota bacterium]MCB9214829.1 hypothetical protein [Ignavibacteria bacterium]
MNIKNFLLVFSLVPFLLFASGQTVFAQDDDFDFEEIQDEFRPRKPSGFDYLYYGLAGGYLGMYAFYEGDQFLQLSQELGIGGNVSGILMHGGGGYLKAWEFPLRLGMYSVAGEAEVSADVQIDNVSSTRTLRVSKSIVVGQLDFSYGIHISGRKVLWLFPGLMIGGETNGIDIIQGSKTTGSFDSIAGVASFDGTDLGNSIQHRSVVIQRRSLHLQPLLSVEYRLWASALSLRLSGGYSFGLGGSWKDQLGNEVTDVPDIKQRFTLHFGAFLDIGGAWAEGLAGLADMK